MTSDGLSRGIPAQDLPENQDESVRYMDIGSERFAVDEHGELGDKIEVKRDFTGATPNPEPVAYAPTEFEVPTPRDMPHLDSPIEVTPINEPAGNAPESDWSQDGPAEGGPAPEEEPVAEEPVEPKPVDEAPAESKPEEAPVVSKRKRKQDPRP